MLSEEELRRQIELVKNSDETAFKHVFAFYQDGVYWYCLKLLKDDSLAEDILQEVFLRLWRNRERIDLNKSLKSYIYTAAHNLCINALRDQKLARDKIKDIGDKDSHNYDPAAIASENQLKEALLVAIEDLPEKCREVFKLSRQDGLSQKEISKKLGIGIKTIETHIGNAIKKIKSSLKNSGFDV